MECKKKIIQINILNRFTDLENRFMVTKGEQVYGYQRGTVGGGIY